MELDIQGFLWETASSLNPITFPTPGPCYNESMSRKINPHTQNPLGNIQDTLMGDSLDDLAAYEAFKSTLMPLLRKAVLEKWTPERIYKEAGTYVAARSVDMALREQDPGKALAAIQEVLNRGFGKATEKVETTHRYEKASDDELDRILASHLQGEDSDGRDQPN